MDKDEKTGQFLAGNKYGRGRKGIRNKFHADFITDLHDHYHMTGAAIAVREARLPSRSSTGKALAIISR